MSLVVVILFIANLLVVKLRINTRWCYMQKYFISIKIFKMLGYVV